MAQFEVRGQSYRWAAYTISLPGDRETWVGKAHVELRKDGNKTYINVVPAETAEPVAVMPVSYSGVISESKHSEGKVLLALSSSGSWSGGSNYAGWLVGRLGARVVFNRKGQKTYHHFVDETKGWEKTGAVLDALPVETM